MQEPTFDVLSLFLLGDVLARTWILEVRLLSERRVQLVLPKISTCGGAHEWIQVLTSVGALAEL